MSLYLLIIQYEQPKVLSEEENGNKQTSNKMNKY